MLHCGTSPQILRRVNPEVLMYLLEPLEGKLYRAASCCKAGVGRMQDVLMSACSIAQSMDDDDTSHVLVHELGQCLAHPAHPSSYLAF